MHIFDLEIPYASGSLQKQTLFAENLDLMDSADSFSWKMFAMKLVSPCCQTSQSGYVFLSEISTFSVLIK